MPGALQANPSIMKDLVWLFGYGSLIWRPDFPFFETRRAYVDGWQRRFWQGSHDHRGVPADPGRVVTLIEAQGERCFGRAYLIGRGVFEHLDRREINGYERHRIQIHFDDGQAAGVMYVATRANPAYLGDAPLEAMVEQIRRAAGKSGANEEYVLRLASALRDLGEIDDHVFELEERLLAG